MAKSDQGAGNKARLVSPFLNTTNKCLELFYWIRSVDDQADSNLTQLSVIAVSEQLLETALVSASGSTVDFTRLFVQLPQGVHRLVIEGRRDTLKVECSISIDDIAVMNCTRFGKHPTLLMRQGNNGYLLTTLAFKKSVEIPTSCCSHLVNSMCIFQTTMLFPRRSGQPFRNRLFPPTVP